jgi:hypothetical protein
MAIVLPFLLNGHDLLYFRKGPWYTYNSHLTIAQPQGTMGWGPLWTPPHCALGLCNEKWEGIRTAREKWTPCLFKTDTVHYWKGHLAFVIKWPLFYCFLLNGHDLLYFRKGPWYTYNSHLTIAQPQGTMGWGLL